MGSKDCPKTIEASGMNLRNTSKNNYPDFITTDMGDPGAAVNKNIIKAKRKLSMDPTATYGLSTIVLRIKDNNCLIALQNTARSMVLGMQIR